MEIVAHHRPPRRARRPAVLAALRTALASGAERVELDVALAGTRLVVAHDDRAAGAADALSLQEALALLAGDDGPRLLADLKRADAALGLGAALAERALGPRTIVCGELGPAVEAARAGGALAAWTLPARRGDHPDARSGPCESATGRARARVRHAACWAVSEGGCSAVCVERRFVDAPLVEAVHAAGGRVYAWTPDREGELRRLVELGVDGLITNDPLTARRLRDAATGVS